MNDKIQKVLANLGYGSRRTIETWIKAGRVTLNNEPVKIGDRMPEKGRLAIDGVLVRLREDKKRRLIIYHKPEGEVCTRSDPQGRPTVFANLPRLQGSRWVAIGRLDLNTSGLLLFTNDGALAHRLMHPSTGIEREYAARILGEVSKVMLKQLRQGVELDDGVAKFTSVTDAGGTGANHWYKVVLHEGRNREVRRLWEAVGAKVSRLIRTRFGNITLPRLLKPGRYKDVTPEELARLLELAGTRPAPGK
jgi:23S rRNA pseudouridine2605 synthase